MNKRKRQVKTGEITYAPRCRCGWYFVKKDHFIGICNGRLAVSTESVNDAVLELVVFAQGMKKFTLFYGQISALNKLGN